MAGVIEHVGLYPVDTIKVSLIIAFLSEILDNIISF